jgi:hypothetical protein
MSFNYNSIPYAKYAHPFSSLSLGHEQPDLIPFSFSRPCKSPQSPAPALGAAAANERVMQRSPKSSSSSSVGCGDGELMQRSPKSLVQKVWASGPTLPLQSVDRSAVRPPGRRLMYMQVLVHILATATWVCGHARSGPHTPFTNLQGRRRSFIVQLCSGDRVDYSFSSYAKSAA